MLNLKEIAEKYDFRYEERLPSEESIPLTEAILAQDTDERWQVWIYIFKGEAYITGNTDFMNLWFYRTRPDLIPEKLIEFANDLNVYLKDSFGYTISVKSLIGPEDWQKIANVSDASKDKRYV